MARTRDPLNVAALPDNGPLNLDYRQPRPDGGVLGLVTGCGLLSFVLVLLGPVAESLSLGWVVPATAMALGLIILGRLWRRVARWERGWLELVTLVGFPLCVLPLGPLASYLVLYPIAILSAFFLADGIATHNGAYSSANPRLDPDVRAAWTQYRLGERREDLLSQLRHLLGLGTSQTRKRGRRRDNAAVALVTDERGLTKHTATVIAGAALAYLIGAVPVLLIEPATLGAAIGVLTAVAVTIGVARWAFKPPCRQATPCSLFPLWRSASCLWWRHGALDNGAPGIWRSPCGKRGSRSALGIFSILVFGASMVRSSSTLTLVRSVGDADPVPTATSRAKPESDVERSIAESMPSESEVLSRLSASERVAIERLPERLRKERYQSLRRQAAFARLADQNAVATHTVQSRGDGTSVVADEPPPFSWSMVLLGLPVSLLVVTSTFVALGVTLTAPVIAHQLATLDSHGSPYEAFATDWDGYVFRLRTSPNDLEREHLFLGHAISTGAPILLHRTILSEHAHIIGDTGAGKTSRGVTPLLAQLAEFPDSSIVVIDLKGDRALFEAARIAAGHVPGRRFRWFSNDAGLSTYAFNPFLQEHFRGLTAHQRAEVLLQSLGLEHGDQYGASYFSRVNRDVLTRLLADYPNTDSFRALRDHVAHLGLKGKQMEDAGELLAVIRSIASFDALNVSPSDGTADAIIDGAIDFGRVATEPEVVYFWLPSAIETASVREIAKLALYSLLTGAQRRSVQSRPGPHIYLFIDEFQQIVSENLQIVLRQARSLGIGTILANQTMSDLRKGPTDLIPVVQANTRFKQAFASSDVLQQDLLIKSSGDAMYILRSNSSWSGASERITYREEIGPRLMRNDLIAATDAPGWNVMHVTRGSGYTQFRGFSFLARTDFHITKSAYETRSSAPWPSVNAETLVAASNPDEVKSKAIPDPVLATTQSPAAPPRSKIAVQAVLDDFDQRMRSASEKQP